MSRGRPEHTEVADWVYKRNTQCNFDTTLQVISLRSQPEVIEDPQKIPMAKEELNKFGFLYQSTESQQYCWMFEFEVHHPSVFDSGNEAFGALYRDCEGVPMILCHTQAIHTPALLNISDELRNIYFEEL